MLKERIQKDLKESLKKEDTTKSLVLRLLLSNIYNQEIEKKAKLRKKGESSKEEIEKEGQLTDNEIIEIIYSEIKKRKEAILEFRKGKREDLENREKKEIEILQEYLPEQLSRNELKSLALEIIEKIGAKELKDLGRVMAEIMPKVRGKAEGSEVSKIVKELLETH